MSRLEEDPVAVAAKLGLAVVLPKRNQLLIDLDSDSHERVFEHMVDVLRSNGVSVVVDRITESAGGNKHAYVTFYGVGEISKEMRVALQASMGSDRKRELLSALRILKKTRKEPTVFFERPENVLSEPTRAIKFASRLKSLFGVNE